MKKYEKKMSMFVLFKNKQNPGKPGKNYEKNMKKWACLLYLKNKQEKTLEIYSFFSLNAQKRREAKPCVFFVT